MQVTLIYLGHNIEDCFFFCFFLVSIIEFGPVFARTKPICSKLLDERKLRVKIVFQKKVEPI